MGKDTRNEEKKLDDKKDKKKKDRTTIAELDEMLLAVPCTSTEYENILARIQKKDRSSYNGQHILCIDATYLKKTKYEADTMEDHHSGGICSHFDLCDFSKENTISGFYPRHMVEYDYRYKQVLTFAYITNADRTEFILLRKKDSKRLGMVGGHTDFSIEAYGMKPQNFLIHNLYKEVFEELTITDKNGKSITSTNELGAETTFKMIINVNDDPYCLRNIGFIYEIKLTNEQFSEYTFASGEPDIHDVVKVKFDDIVNAKHSHRMLRFIPDAILKAQMERGEDTESC